MITSINVLMKEHDKKLTGKICDLVAEKMNNSIKYMTTSAQNMSAMLTAQKHRDLQALYDEFADLEGDGYVSMGLIDDSGKVYASDQQLAEFVTEKERIMRQRASQAEQQQTEPQPQPRPQGGMSGSANAFIQMLENMAQEAKNNPQLAETIARFMPK